jgi:hypothetical protein
VKVSAGQEDMVKDINWPGVCWQMLIPDPVNWMVSNDYIKLAYMIPILQLNLPNGYFFESFGGRIILNLSSLYDWMIQLPVLPSLESPSPGW